MLVYLILCAVLMAWFMLVYADTIEPQPEQLVKLPLLIVSLGAAAIVVVLSEMLHWLLVQSRRRRRRAGSI